MNPDDPNEPDELGPNATASPGGPRARDPERKEIPMLAGSSGQQAGADLDRADHARRRRLEGGLTFSSAEGALRWFYEAKERMQSPHNLHPRGEEAASGEVVFVSVDGGRGGDVDEVLTTISTIGRLLRRLAETHPQEHKVLELTHRDGKSLRDVESPGLSKSSVSQLLGRAEMWMHGALREAGVLR